MKKILICLIIGIVLTSCAVHQSDKIPQTFSADSEAGMIIGAIAIKNEEPLFNEYLIYYNVNEINKTSNKRMIEIKPKQTVTLKLLPDHFDGDKAVYYFCIKEPAGRYNFNLLKLNKIESRTGSNNIIPINYGFNIENGKVKYFGEMYINFNHAEIHVQNKKDRDQNLLIEKFPNLKVEFDDK